MSSQDQQQQHQQGEPMASSQQQSPLEQMPQPLPLQRRRSVDPPGRMAVKKTTKPASLSAVHAATRMVAGGANRAEAAAAAAAANDANKPPQTMLPQNNSSSSNSGGDNQQQHPQNASQPTEAAVSSPSLPISSSPPEPPVEERPLKTAPLSPESMRRQRRPTDAVEAEPSVSGQPFNVPISERDARTALESSRPISTTLGAAMAFKRGLKATKEPPSSSLGATMDLTDSNSVVPETITERESSLPISTTLGASMAFKQGLKSKEPPSSSLGASLDFTDSNSVVPETRTERESSLPISTTLGATKAFKQGLRSKEPPSSANGDPDASTTPPAAASAATATAAATTPSVPTRPLQSVHVATRLLRLSLRHSGASQMQHDHHQHYASPGHVDTPTADSHTGSSTAISNSAISTDLPTAPGAYLVTKHRLAGTVTYRIRVPDHVAPGDDFEVELPATTATSAGQVAVACRRVQVVCPRDATGPNVEIQIAVPHPATYRYKALKMAQLTASPTLAAAIGMDNTTQHAKASIQDNGYVADSVIVGGAHAMMPDIERINQVAVDAGGTVRTHVVTIPHDVVPGQSFKVRVHGRRFSIACPESCRPGERLRIVPPPEVADSKSHYQSFAVRIPNGVAPGGQFTVMVGSRSGAHGLRGQHVLVDCPASASPGQTVRIQLPTAASKSSNETNTDNAQLTYSSGTGWTRTIRASDMKFQWVRINDAVVDNSVMFFPRRNDCSSNSINTSFDFYKSAYVRKLVEHEGNDPRLRTATMELVTAEQAVVDGKLKTNEGDILFTYADIIALQQGSEASGESGDATITTSLTKKHQWFLSTCQRLMDSVTKVDDPLLNHHTAELAETGDTEVSVKLLVRREYLLHDSIRGVLSLSADDMRRRWEIEFCSEPGFDRGGLTKEWFELVTEQIFHPNFGLFVSSVNNQAAVDINPAIGMMCPDDFLQSYRFVGRVMGRSLFTGHLIRGHLVRLLYKHLLGWPTTHEDVKDLDEDLHSGLLKLTQMDDVSAATLDFTATEDCMGTKVEQELVVDGSSIAVTNENVDAYLEQSIRYRTFNRILPQLTELLLGFYDVVPEPALSVFDVSEFELVLCGLPTIDLNDWRSHTMYSCLFQDDDADTLPVVQWFWDIVAHDFDDEMKARLLQFATGTSGVNLGGFAHLQGSDGYMKQFTIHGVDPDQYFYPKSHTCFNQLDLPNYETRQVLKERLIVSVTTSYVGFDIK